MHSFWNFGCVQTCPWEKLHCWINFRTTPAIKDPGLWWRVMESMRRFVMTTTTAVTIQTPCQVKIFKQWLKVNGHEITRKIFSFKIMCQGYKSYQPTQWQSLDAFCCSVSNPKHWCPKMKKQTQRRFAFDFFVFSEITHQEIRKQPIFQWSSNVHVQMRLQLKCQQNNHNMLALATYPNLQNPSERCPLIIYLYYYIQPGLSLLF